MSVSSVLFAVVVLILVVSLLCIWFFPSIQDFMASNTMWNGINSFSREFDADIIESLERLPSLPERHTLVAIPYLEYSNKELSRMKQFVDEGGTLILMDDYGYGNSVLAFLGVGVRFSNEPLLDPLFCHKNQWLPKIIDFAPEADESGIGVIVLNHATSLTSLEQAEIIAWSSSTSFLDINENESWDEDEPKGPLPVAAEFHLGKGTVALLSDPSIMINSMVGRDDNYSLIRYLTTHEGEETKMLIDSAHLPKAPLDTSKSRLNSSREIIAAPYPLLGIVALIFVVVSRYTLKTGGTIGRE